MLDLMKTFIDLLETRSFSRTARLNGMTQSAVSQRIRQLEEGLGHQLVVRGRGNLEPTEAGSIFFKACIDMHGRFSQVEDELARLKDSVAGNLRVAAVPTVGLHELPRFVGKYLRAYPDASLNLEYRSSKAIYEGVVNQLIDIGVVACPVRKSQITTIPFRHDELVLIVRQKHRLAGAGEISVDDLRGCSFISFSPGMPTRKMMDKLLRAAGVQVNLVQEFDNVETIKRAVEIGPGVSIVPKPTVEHEVKAGSLVALPIEGDQWERPLALIVKKGRHLSLAAEKFIDILTSENGN